MTLPREGHLEAAVHIMDCMGHKYNSSLVSDPSFPDANVSVFKKCDLTEFYWDVKDTKPINAPESR